VWRTDRQTPGDSKYVLCISASCCKNSTKIANISALHSSSAVSIHVIAICITFRLQLLASNILFKCGQLLNVTTEWLDITAKQTHTHTTKTHCYKHCAPQKCAFTHFGKSQHEFWNITTLGKSHPTVDISATSFMSVLSDNCQFNNPMGQIWSYMHNGKYFF